MRWLARWARRMADIIDPPSQPLRPLSDRADGVSPLRLLSSSGRRPYCVACDREHEPPLHYHPL